MTEITAIEIESPKIYEIIQTLQPEYRQPYEEVHQHFLLINWPDPGMSAIMAPSNVRASWSIEDGMSITLKQLVK